MRIGKGSKFYFAKERYFILGDRLSEGGYGSVFNAKTNCGTDVIMKTSKRTEDDHTIQMENLVYKTMERKEGFPTCFHFSECENQSFIFLQPCGLPLVRLLEKHNRGILKENTANLAVSLLQIIESLHKRYFVHRDIKPSNILFNTRKEKGQVYNFDVYLIDFGNAKQFRNKTEFLIREGEEEFCAGTRTFSSPSWHRRVSQSCKDDILSLTYVLAFLCSGRLPWSNIKVTTRKGSLALADFKESVSWTDLFPNCPIQFRSFVNYVKRLKFEDKIDYKRLINYMENVLQEKRC